MSSRTRADFHAHLDRCEQCANHPFELCSEGARLLNLAAAEPEFYRTCNTVEAFAAAKVAK